MLFMRMRGRFGWRWAAAAVLIALLVLGLGFILRSAGLGAAADAAQLVALVPLIGGVIAWARTRRGVPREPSDQMITFGEFLRIIADAQGLTGRDLYARMEAWDGEAIDGYLDGNQWPPWEFVRNFLDVVAEDDRWRREALERRVRPVWQAAAGHQLHSLSFTIVPASGGTELSSNGEWFTALQHVSRTRDVLRLVQRSVDRHQALGAGLAEMLERLAQAVISLTSERDRMRAELNARKAERGESPRTLVELDDLHRQLRDTQERLRFAERTHEATAQRLEESERQRLLAERLRDEALNQADRARRRLTELEGRPAALPRVRVSLPVTEDSGPTLMGVDDQHIAEEVLRRIDEVLRDEGKALDNLEDRLADAPWPESTPSHGKPTPANQSLLHWVPLGNESAASATTAGPESDDADTLARPRSPWAPQDMQANKPGSSSGVPKGSKGRSHGYQKGAWARSFRKWTVTTYGVISLAVCVIALAAGDGAIAAHVGSSATTLTGRARPGRTVAGPLSPLAQALLPAQELGSAATTTGSGTDLSQLAGICGEPLPNSAKAAAFESVQDSKTNQDLEETIIDWANTSDSSNAVSSSRNAINHTGSCSTISNGMTEDLTADQYGSPPPECSNGQYLAAQMTIQPPMYSGYVVMMQCGKYTISISISMNFLDDPLLVTEETADGYLGNAAARLQKTI